MPPRAIRARPTIIAEKTSKPKRGALLRIVEWRGQSSLPGELLPARAPNNVFPRVRLRIGNAVLRRSAATKQIATRRLSPDRADAPDRPIAPRYHASIRAPSPDPRRGLDAQPGPTVCRWQHIPNHAIRCSALCQIVSPARIGTASRAMQVRSSRKFIFPRRLVPRMVPQCPETPFRFLSSCQPFLSWFRRVLRICKCLRVRAGQAAPAVNARSAALELFRTANPILT